MLADHQQNGGMNPVPCREEVDSVCPAEINMEGKGKRPSSGADINRLKEKETEF